MNISEFKNAGRSVELAENINREYDDNTEMYDQLYSVCAHYSAFGIPTYTAMRLISFMTRYIHAQSVILLGDTSLIEAKAICESIEPSGLLTIIDTNERGAELSRNLCHSLQSGRLRLRIVTSDPNQYLKKLNAGGYDMIVVSGLPANYEAAWNAAQHLLQKHGLLILTDSFAQSSAKEGLLNPADRSEKTVLLRSLLQDLRESTVFESLPLPVSDGLTLAFKK
ncbi:MAG: hypothetical protein IKS59_02170 [Aeriscardovia sp.]|nr:hypothetical protein [Aeriscardovia sp.]